MAYTSTDLANIEQAILDLATGKRVVQVMIDGKLIRYSEIDIGKLKALLSDIQASLETVPLRTYAKQGGRGA